jgi:xanthine/uracil permease
LIILLAIVFGLFLGGVMFVVAEFAIQSHPILLATFAGIVVGVILGVIVGLLRRGSVRGAIGQDLSKVNVPDKKPEQEAQTVIAIRLQDPDNISRKSKARAILINNKGKIDRSVGRDT